MSWPLFLSLCATSIELNRYLSYNVCCVDNYKHVPGTRNNIYIVSLTDKVIPFQIKNSCKTNYKCYM